MLAGCSVAGSAPPAPAGAELFQLCAQCHAEDGSGNQSVNAPAIAALPQWFIEAQLRKFREGGRGTHFDDLSGMQMRPMALSLMSDAEVTAVSKYVASLPPKRPPPVLTGGDAKQGQAGFATCSACHGPEAGGNEALKAPPLYGMSDWYLLTSLQKFKAGIRGANPKDASGATMRPMAQTLADEQAMKNVIAYIMTLER